MTHEAVPFVDLAGLHAGMAADLNEAFGRVIATSDFGLGSEVEAFEREFAAYCGAEYCVGVASGTAAIALGLRAAGIGRGEEVIVPGLTFIASALAVLHAGATPVFCDVEESTGLIDPRAAEDVVTARTSAILAVHLYGQLCDVDALRRLADRRGLALLEDAAQAHGAASAAGRAGSFGRFAAFSFYPSKNLGALGNAGAVCTSDAELACRCRQLRDLGRRGKRHAGLGFNERLDGIQAAVLRAKLPRLDDWNEQRRRNAEAYRVALGPAFGLLPRREGSVFHLFPIRAGDRDGLAARLREEGIATGVHYSPAAHLQPSMREYGVPGALPSSEAWAAEELSLPMYPGLPPAHLERVARSCRAHPAAAT